MAAEVIDGCGFEYAVETIAGVVDKDFDLAEASDGGGNGGIDGGLVIDVECCDESVGERSELGRGVWVAHGCDDVPAFGLEVLGGGETYADGRAGDEDGFGWGHGGDLWWRDFDNQGLIIRDGVMEKPE